MDTMESPRSPKRRRILGSINPTFGPDQDTDLDRKVHRVPASASATVPPQYGPDRIPAPVGPSGDQPAEPSEAINQEFTSRQTSGPRPSRVRFKSPSRRRHRSSREDDDGYHRHRDRKRDRDHDLDRGRDRRKDDGSSRGKENENEASSTRHRHRRHRSRSRSQSPASSSHHHRHRHHHRRKRQDRSRHKEPQQPEPEPQDPFAEEPLDPEAAFRESLFDAMADDEGAAYWEGVYGQPIHIYSSDRLNTQGELERMTDEEYAAYVRQKMWEKTHAGLLEEREKRKKQAEERARREEEDRRIQIELEKSLRRGEKRRTKRAWKEKWDRYVDAWDRWDGKGVEGIPWPIDRSVLVGGENGREEVDSAAGRAFFVNCLNLEEVGEREFAAKLKDERVRWHPDKFQQKLGGTVEESVMRDVTAIFQVIDALWNDMRKNI